MLFFILCVSTSLALATPVNNVYSLEEGPELFETFMNDYNKQYEGKEKEKRLQIFINNLKEINSLNEESSNAVFGITKFTDLTKEEFIQTYTGFIPNKNRSNRKYEAPVRAQFHNYTAPAAFDWRTKGVVGRVKDQGICGSSWAFSVCGNVESINAIKTGSIVEISEQQLVDCEKTSLGCDGGYPDYALKSLVQNGAMSLESYPYEGSFHQFSCRYDRNKVVVHLASSENIVIQEPEIVEKLVQTGPLSIVLDADILQSYTGGIIVEGCNTNTLQQHSALLVGYGQENGVDYWIMKNSWAESWGESGYFRIKKGINCLNLVEYGVSTAVI